jgi:Holliday junction resolvase-like predicted endonuclease
MTIATQHLGALGQKMAERYFKSLGHHILVINFKLPFGEIDLITKFQKSIYFIEIKTTKDGLVSPYKKWKSKQKLRMYKVAKFFLEYNPSIRYEDLNFELIWFDLLANSKVRLKRYKNIELDYG